MKLYGFPAVWCVRNVLCFDVGGKFGESSVHACAEMWFCCSRLLRRSTGKSAVACTAAMAVSASTGSILAAVVTLVASTCTGEQLTAPADRKEGRQGQKWMGASYRRFMSRFPCYHGNRGMLQAKSTIVALQIHVYTRDLHHQSASEERQCRGSAEGWSQSAV